MESNRTFEALNAWKLAREFKKSVKVVCSTFPLSEERRLKDQLIRSTRSVSANIAEGWGRFHFQENIQFCRQARGSLTESLDHLIEAVDCKYIDEATFETLKKEYEVCLLVLNGYIKFLRKSKQESL